MKVKIYTTPEFDCVNLLFYYEIGKEKHIIKPVKLTSKPYKEGDLIEPTIKLNSYDSNEFMQNMADALRNSGIRTKQDELNEGELKAVKYHLEDLRKLLKINH